MSKEPSIKAKPEVRGKKGSSKLGTESAPKSVSSPKKDRAIRKPLQSSPAAMQTAQPMAVTEDLTRHLYGLVLHAIKSGSIVQNFELKEIKNEMGHFVGDWRVTVERTR